MSKVWKVPVTWEVCGFVEVPKSKFPTLQKAIKHVATDESIDLPDAEYVDGSFHITNDLNEADIRECFNNSEADVVTKRSETQTKAKANTRHYEIGYRDYDGEEKEFVADAVNFDGALTVLYETHGAEDPKIISVVEDGVKVI